MIYVSNEDFAAIREQMADDMLEAATRLTARVLPNAEEGTFKGKTLAELRELAVSVLTEKLDIWPEHCREDTA